MHVRKFIEELIERYRVWRRLKAFEREFYETFPQHHSDEDMIRVIFLLGVLDAILLLLIIQSC